MLKEGRRIIFFVGYGYWCIVYVLVYDLWIIDAVINGIIGLLKIKRIYEI